MATSDPVTPPAEVPLRDLVRERRAALGLSYEKLGERCIDPESGETVGGSWLHRLETGRPVLAPGVPQLRAIAAGIQVPDELVREAAAVQFFGVTTVWSADRRARALVLRYQGMSEEDRRRIDALVETFSATSKTPDAHRE
ncbi:helix-turn-helix domain-containing protein [Streptomyces sp. NPDC102274]|uniref:helix-turn-helix domain-containing protein n=1 Tax=Streptomyces sp. NPDC102274 TaxID=3366151 RepID=UPI0037F7004C